jgi:hypothetical protein
MIAPVQMTMAHHKTVDIPSFVSPIALAQTASATGITIRASICHGRALRRWIAIDACAIRSLKFNRMDPVLR